MHVGLLLSAYVALHTRTLILFSFFFSIHSRPFKNKLKPMDSLDHTSSFYNNIYIIYPSTNRERWFDDQKLTW